MPVVLLEHPAEHVALVRINRQDQKEGMQAFIEKRKPDFQGR